MDMGPDSSRQSYPGEYAGVKLEEEVFLHTTPDSAIHSVRPFSRNSNGNFVLICNRTIAQEQESSPEASPEHYSEDSEDPEDPERTGDPECPLQQPGGLVIQGK